MNKIEVKVLNCQAVAEAEKNMVFAARLTQRGQTISGMEDLLELYEQSFTDKTAAAIASLPHPTVQKFAVITIAVVGASRRFLAQITRHQNEVKFMSASLQYSKTDEFRQFEQEHYRICWPKSLADYGYDMTDDQALVMRSLGSPYGIAQLREWFGEDFPFEETRSRRRELMEECLDREGIECKPGAVELLKELRRRGIVTAVATATDMERTGRYLKRAGLDEYFNRILSVTMVERGKPAPDEELKKCIWAKVQSLGEIISLLESEKKEGLLQFPM